MFFSQMNRLKMYDINRTFRFTHDQNIKSSKFSEEIERKTADIEPRLRKELCVSLVRLSWAVFTIPKFSRFCIIFFVCWRILHVTVAWADTFSWLFSNILRKVSAVFPAAAKIFLSTCCPIVNKRLINSLSNAKQFLIYFGGKVWYYES